jgi:Flp pilus assembly protein TadD
MCVLSACSQQGATPPPQEKALMQMADTMAKNGSTEDAIKLYEQLVTTNGRNLDYHLELARLYRSIDRLPQAIAVLEKAYSVDDDDVRVRKQLGFALLAAGQNEAALELFSRWVEDEPKSADALGGYAMALDYKNDHTAAQAAYQKAIALSPANAMDIKNNLGMSYILAGKWSAAIDLLEPLVKAGAGKTTRQNLALAYGLKGDKKKALAMNLKDLPEAKAKENMRFYEEYLKRLKKGGRLPTIRSATSDATTQQAAPVGKVSLGDDEADSASKSLYPSGKNR